MSTVHTDPKAADVSSVAVGGTCYSIEKAQSPESAGAGKSAGKKVTAEGIAGSSAV